MRTSLPHIKALDGLRGVAVVMILLFHAGHLRGGWLGVDLFFVLSGFLITSLLLSEWDTTGGVSLRAFWWRRGRRLLPALYALLIGVCAWAAVFAGRADIDRIREEGIATLFYVANWHAIYAGHDYWEIFRAPSPLDHTWSLAIEEQFYLFWPPIVIIVLREFRGSHRALWRTAVAMAVASAGWMLFLFDPAEGTARVYFGADTRAAATLLGAAVAASQSMRLRSWPGKNYTFGDAIAGAGFAVLLAGAILLDGHNPIVYRGGLFALTIASCGIIVGLLLAPNGIMSRTLSAPPIRAIGTISYGLYLWHWPIFITMTPERMGVEGLALTVERLLVTFAFASISFYGLEKPIRRGGFAGPRLWTTATVSVCTMLFLGWVVVPGGGASRLIKSKAVASATEDHNSVDVLLIGDSIPYILGPEFVKAAEQHNIKSKVMGIEACGALRTTGLRYLSGHTFDLIPCLSHRRNWIATTRAFKPPSVIIFEGWSGEGSKKLGGKWSSPCSSHYDSAYTRDLTDLVDK
ncbi:MAG: peptidoglycan/LPS O-acetylase OafA/YrhL, partial [Myxococcota bacterium]